MASLVLVTLVVHPKPLSNPDIFSTHERNAFPTPCFCQLLDTANLLSVCICPFWTFHICGNMPLFYISIILTSIHVLKLFSGPTVTEPKLGCPLFERPIVKRFLIGKEYDFYSEDSHLGRRQTIVQKPFLPGPEILRGLFSDIP